VASAPNPYTVYVGKPTSCPFRIIYPNSYKYYFVSGTTVALTLS